MGGEDSEGFAFASSAKRSSSAAKSGGGGIEGRAPARVALVHEAELGREGRERGVGRQRVVGRQRQGAR